MNALRHLLLLSIVTGALASALAAPAAARAVTDDGLVPEQTALVASSGGNSIAADDQMFAPHRAARPFSHLSIRRVADIPPGAALTLFVRASVDGIAWSNWQAIGHDDDTLLADDEAANVSWSGLIDVGALASSWQLRAERTAGPDGAQPTIERVDVNTIDATRGPSTAAIAGDAAPQASIAGLPAKPGVISRSAWGSPDGQGSRVPPDYYAVDHLVVHHTADPNPLIPVNQVDWAAKVRAIWSYHALTRRWGDIGYNYLIDPLGNVYEGRAGGDNAVGFHDTANYGSMGVSMIGTYSTIAPSAATQDALVRLLAWKAAQRDIDPLGSSAYYGCSLSRYCNDYSPNNVVPNISGHRQVTPNHTTCPGDATMAVFGSIKQRVRQLMSGGGSGPIDNGDLTIDNAETGFARSPASWYEVPCGFGGQSLYSFATDDAAQSSNSATWRPRLPTGGSYRLAVYIPFGCGLNQATGHAVYKIRHADGSSERSVDQSASAGWVDLGVYRFNAGTDGAVELYDVTGEPLGLSRVLYFDAVRWTPEDTSTSAALVGVSFDRATVTAGDLVKAMFTVENTGQRSIGGQDPQPDPADGAPYVYNQGECFDGAASGSYPSFVKRDDAFRVTLGFSGWDAANRATCTGATSDSPWRWGVVGTLAPGARQTISGYVRFTRPGTYALQAGLVQENVRYHSQGVPVGSITVTPETRVPQAVLYDDDTRPLARVYRLGDVPNNFLARADAASLPRGDQVSTMSWDGGTKAWGNGGPSGMTDGFIVEQVRTFVVQIPGIYTFRTLSDDGSWLAIDGQTVVSNGGLHDLAQVSGDIWLDVGVHTLAFVMFDRVGNATAGYDARYPGSPVFSPLVDGLGSGALRLGSSFVATPSLVLAADDFGGSGVAKLSWSWDGVEWTDVAGSVVSIGRLQNGKYRLFYRATDANGNQGPPLSVSFAVDTSLVPYRNYAPLAMNG